MKIDNFLLVLCLFSQAATTLVTATTTNNNGYDHDHDETNHNSTSINDGQDISPLFIDEPTVAVSASSLLQYADVVDQQQQQLILRLRRNDAHDVIIDGDGEVYVGVGGGGGGGGSGGDGGGGGGAGGGGSNQLQQDWRTNVAVLEVMRHTARHSISMSQYGQQITVNVASADSPRDLSDNIQARVGVPMEEEPVLYLNGGADNEFMPDDMFEYNEEEKGEEEEEKEEVENNSSLFQDENVNELSNQYTIQPMPEEMVGDLSHLPTEPTQPGARTLLGRLQSSPIGRKIFPKKRTRSARSPAVHCKRKTPINSRKT